MDITEELQAPNIGKSKGEQRPPEGPAGPQDSGPAETAPSYTQLFLRSEILSNLV